MVAKRVVTLRVSDLSGAELAEGEGQTLTFAVGSDQYEMDVTDAEAAEFAEALKPYTSAATKVRGRGVRRASRGTSSAPGETTLARQWARENGHEVSDRGRVPAEVMEAYRAQAGN